MKLQELSQPKVTKKIAKVFESYFGNRVAFEHLTAKQTRSMLNRVRGLIREHRMSTDRHFGEKNPAYLKLVMMEQALSGHLQEMSPPAPVTPQTSAAPQTSTTAVDPKLKAAKDKLAKKQPLSQDEQNLINAAAVSEQTSRLRRAFRTLKESEVQQAQVVLAAQDMVDSMQGMIEDATEMQYKELPALVDSIRNQIGAEQANQFNTDSTAALTNLVQSLQGAKQQLETALGVVTGQAPAVPAMDAGMPAPDMPPVDGADMPPPMDADIDADLDVEVPSGTAGTLGRERR